MKVSPLEPFQLIYSLYQHEYLGYLIESFVVQLDEKGRLSFRHQNISSKNADEFSSVMDERDFELIKIMDTMQQESVIKHFVKKKVKPDEFFLKTYNKDKGNEVLQQQIEAYLERRRTKVLELIHGKNLYEMGHDGEPAWKKIEICKEKATVLFHFRRNEENTHYFPTIKHQGEKVEFQYKGAYIICKQPAWMVVNDKLLSFEKEVDGNKLKPFLNKKFIVIPKKVEETYYKKFVSQLVASFDVYAKGFDIVTETFPIQPVLKFSELAEASQATLSLFDGGGDVATAEQTEVAAGKIVFDISFKYGPYSFRADNSKSVSVSMERDGDNYTFHRVRRNLEEEHAFLEELRELGWNFRNGRFTASKTHAFGLLNLHRTILEARGVLFEQTGTSEKRYFLGKSSIDIEVRENIDWFDIYAVVKFGDFEIPFKELRKLMMKGKAEFNLPSGEVAVIPETWFSEYGELFAFMEEGQSTDSDFALKKHHLALVKDLETGNLARVSMSRKLERLREFDRIEEAPVPEDFKGELRPYQKAGFNWMAFLNKYNFGGCLADDMGLGKTVQTLALLQSQKEAGCENASLLVMPTSLIYNWEREANRFTPNLKVFTYTGTSRLKNIEQFQGYDLVLTSYGIVRLDAEILKEYYFNYIILDESQAIKNPTSNIAKAVRKLSSRQRLILTGTPLENSTMDLWSQMNFINPGLLGNQSFFRNEFLNPIEKKKNEKKTEKLYTIIKPFILRRHKSQVATELPEKVENVQYSEMSKEQAEVYEETKQQYREEIIERIEKGTLKDSQFLLLQGLTKLRQIANHPSMVDEKYEGTSGKMDDVYHMLHNAIRDDHKILIFSSFVKHLKLLSKRLDEAGHSYAYLDGSTKNRQREVERFQEDPSLRIFLISLKAGGLGLNLTQADYVFLLDPWWNPAIEAQAVDRAHRIGQKNKVFTYKFITKETVEEKILALQAKKRQLAADLITTEESFVKNLTKENIISLLE
ncbi:MAG: SNF2-related protein [Bacteroidota bacterium]